MDTESARTQLLTDLTPWTQYAVTITPYKGQYTGQESRVVIAKTGPDGKYISQFKFNSVDYEQHVEKKKHMKIVVQCA